MSLLDFNNASTQDCGNESIDKEARLERLKREITHNAQSILTHLFPQGKYDSRAQEFEVGNLSGDPGKSLKVSLKPNKFGTWKDFASGEKGGDLIALWMDRKSCTFSSAIQEMESLIGVSNSIAGVKANRPAPDSGNGNSPVQWEGETSKKPPADLGKPTKTWHYRDATGNIIASVTRYDPEGGGKEFRPWDVKNKKRQHPEVRPLYNQPGITRSSQVVLVEGEKCAEALMGIGICATTAMGGANAPTAKTDWSPLTGKDVTIWPDNDQAGREHAEEVYFTLLPVAKSVRILTVPENAPAKWDAADAVQEGFDVHNFLRAEQRTPRKYKINLHDWSMEAYQGHPPERQWLVEHVFPMGALSILAASGGTGKGLLSLDLALKVICDYEAANDLLQPWPKAFDNPVVQAGSVVIFSAEDDRDELHRRLEQLDPSGNRYSSKHQLILVPLPNAGGPSPIVVPGKNGPEITPFYKDIHEQLLSIPDLKLVVFDPLSSFAMVDLVKNPTDCVFVNGVLSSLAADTKASIMAIHHLNKLRIDKPIMSADHAREMISGSARVIDGVRIGYCIWPMDANTAKQKCARLGVEYRHDLVFCGAVVKSNLPVDKQIKVFLRDSNSGLLVAVNDALKLAKITHPELLEILIDLIRRAAMVGRPFTTYGRGTCPNDRIEELPDELKDVGQKRMRSMIDELLDAQKVQKCITSGSKVPQWLDIPGGPFSLGTGVFEPGFVEI